MLSASTAHADPPATVDAPEVFCFRITDIERISGLDGSDGNDFVFEFEVLNWTDTPVAGVEIIANIGTSGRGLGPAIGASPTIAGIGIDRDGRGGPVGGTDIDASGLGLTSGSGTFDPIAIQSGRGRGDIAGHLNDWDAASFSAREALWDVGSGTVIPNVDLIAAGVDAIDLVPGNPPVLDALGDTAVDGGPTPYTAGRGAGQPSPDGSGNVLDGFTLTMTDWDVGEFFSFNWSLLNGAGDPIGTAGSPTGNPYGFGVVSLARLDPGGVMPTPLFPFSTGFANAGSLSFFDTVWAVPNPTEFALEFAAGVSAPVPLPPAGALLVGAVLILTRPLRRRTKHSKNQG